MGDHPAAVSLETDKGGATARVGAGRGVRRRSATGPALPAPCRSAHRPGPRSHPTSITSISKPIRSATLAYPNQLGWGGAAREARRRPNGVGRVGSTPPTHTPHPPRTSAQAGQGVDAARHARRPGTVVGVVLVKEGGGRVHLCVVCVRACVRVLQERSPREVFWRVRGDVGGRVLHRRPSFGQNGEVRSVARARPSWLGRLCVCMCVCVCVCVCVRACVT